jgi:hypothetical protein
LGSGLVQRREFARIVRGAATEIEAGRCLLPLRPSSDTVLTHHGALSLTEVAMNHAEARADLAAAFRLTARENMHEGVANHFSLAVNEDGTEFLINPKKHFSRIRASDLWVIDADDPDSAQGRRRTRSDRMGPACEPPSPRPPCALRDACAFHLCDGSRLSRRQPPAADRPVLGHVLQPPGRGHGLRRPRAGGGGHALRPPVSGPLRPDHDHGQSRRALHRRNRGRDLHAHVLFRTRRTDLYPCASDPRPCGNCQMEIAEKTAQQIRKATRPKPTC